MTAITCSGCLEKELRKQVANLQAAIRKMLHCVYTFQAMAGARDLQGFVLYFEIAKAELHQFDVSDKEIINSVADKAIEIKEMSDALLTHCRLDSLRPSPTETSLANVGCLGSRRVH